MQTKINLNQGHIHLKIDICVNFYIFAEKIKMEIKELLINNIDYLCRERKWTRRDLAQKMGIMEASLSRSLKGNPTLGTLEKIAKALDVSIKSLFEDSNDVEGFVLLKGKAYHFNSLKELMTIEMINTHKV
jgi:transcriptional regulator with XRE-family HTH domain